MPIDISKLNPRGKLKNLIAQDLFEETQQQLFCPETGDLIGMVKDGKEVYFKGKGEPETKPQANPKQMNLF